MTSKCIGDENRKHIFSWAENSTAGRNYGVTAMEAVLFDSVNAIQARTVRKRLLLLYTSDIKYLN